MANTVERGLETGFVPGESLHQLWKVGVHRGDDHGVAAQVAEGETVEAPSLFASWPA